MLTLYYRPACPYCQKVLEYAQGLGVSFDLRDIDTTAAHEQELIAKGGKRQVPFLVDTKSGVSMYESDDIIAYVGAGREGVAKVVRVHTSGSSSNVCS